MREPGFVHDILNEPVLSATPLALEDDDDDDDEEPEVGDLLWSAQVRLPAPEPAVMQAAFPDTWSTAQMDFIGHRNAQAIAKLHQAVALRSSAACVTLGK